MLTSAEWFIAKRERGFSIIELMVSVSLIAILVMLAAPSLATYTQNSKVRAAAESFLAGVQSARVEALRTNLPVEMVLTTDAPIAANKDTPNTSSTSGSWLVRRVATSGTTSFIDGKSALEGSGTGGASLVTVNAITASGAAQPTVTFTSSGNTNLGTSWQVDFGSASANCASASPPGPVRCLRVIVKPSGQVKSCDPAATAPDSRAC